MYRTSSPSASIFDNTHEKVYSISEISNILRGVVENHFSHITIKGELSAVKRHTSGHIYFALKDHEAVLDGVCWRGIASKLSIQPQEGIEVICVGRITTYPGRSKYQMIVESMELAGEGVLLKQLNDLRKKLAAEGLFDLNRKKALPFLPHVIGVITSPTGAVIRDILHRIEDRFPRPIILWPVAVQGDQAAQNVIKAIQGFNAMDPNGPITKPDLLIIARGGGSLEDLWPFNNEELVRTVANSIIPIISAIGHETDTTLIDYAADYRAPTPTAAAEHAVPVRANLRAQLESFSTRMIQIMRRFIEDKTQRLDEQSQRLYHSLTVFLQIKNDYLQRFTPQSPRIILEHHQDRLQFMGTRLDAIIKNYLLHHHQRLENLKTLLTSYSYNKTLERGFALARTLEGQIVRRAQNTSPGDCLTLTFYDGHLTTIVTDSDAHPKHPPKTKSPQKPKKKRETSLSSTQPKLF